MPTNVKVIAHSADPFGREICSMQLQYPRFIHSEFMTHRVFSRSASSSRAIPITKLIQDAIDNPAYPVHFGAHQKGMQADLEVGDIGKAMRLWMSARDDAVRNARIMADMGLHKQVVNRILEPFTHINVIVTSTQWDNFFDLRAHKDAQPEIQALAVAMQKALRLSVPSKLGWGDYHLPYITVEEKSLYSEKVLCKISTARCARVSYNKHDGEVPSVEEDLQLYEKLVGSEPLHASPAEHQAFACNDEEGYDYAGNLLTWVQYRKLLEVGLV